MSEEKSSTDVKEDKKQEKRDKGGTDAEIDAAKEKKEKKKKAKMKAGDYVVQVHIIEARDLKGVGGGAMSDPVTVVEVMGKKYHTSIKKQSLSCLWDEILVFELRGKHLEELKSASINISVMDANRVRKDVLIGAFSFDLSQVYFEDHHEVYRRWIALMNPKPKAEGIQGFLRLSLAVLGPDDEQFVHPPEDDEDEDMSGIMMPPSLEQKASILRMQFYKFIDLPVMDEQLVTVGQKCDPYVKILFGGINLRSKVYKGQNVENVNVELQIPVMEPTMSTSINVSVFDWDRVDSDDLISSFRVDYGDMKNNPSDYSVPRWVSMYGAPEGEDGDFFSKDTYAVKMNNGYVEGSYYRGQVLMSACVEAPGEGNIDPKPELTLVNGEAGMDKVKFSVIMDMYEGSEIANVSKKWRVEVHLGREIMHTRRKTVRGGRIKWYEIVEGINGSFCEEQNVDLDTETEEQSIEAYKKRFGQIPDVFVYLSYGKDALKNSTRVSYLRFPMWKLIRECRESNYVVPPKWHILQECKALDKLDDAEFPGTLMFSLRADRTERMQMYDLKNPGTRPLKEMKMPPNLSSDPNEPETQQAEEKKKPLPTFGKLTLIIKEAKKLPAMDKRRFGKGSSDPYCKIKTNEGDESFKTEVIKKELDPKWGKTCVFQNPVHINDTVLIDVFDWDAVGRDEIMGTVSFTLHEIQKDHAKTEPGENISYEQWWDINSQHVGAQVSISIKYNYCDAPVKKKKRKSKKSFFSNMKNLVVDDKHEDDIVPNELLGMPDFQNFVLRAHFYMARNLPAVDNNGLADPYIIIRLAGQSLKFKKKTKTLNPQWYQGKQKDEVLLPVNHGELDFAPSLQCFVFDWDALGKDDPIGRFSISCPEIRTMNRDLQTLSPTWFNLKTFDNQEIPDSKVLATFQLLDADDMEEIGEDEELPCLFPPTTPTFLQIVTLGLRRMQSAMGINKCYVDFELPNGKRFGTKKSRIPSRKNPNFLQVLKIPVDLPNDRIFAPIVDIQVRDALMGGFVKRLLGAATLDISSYLDQPAEEVHILSDKEVEEEKKRIKEEEERKKREEEERKKREEEERKKREEERKKREEEEKTLEQNAGDKKADPKSTDVYESPDDSMEDDAINLDKVSLLSDSTEEEKKEEKKEKNEENEEKEGKGEGKIEEEKELGDTEKMTEDKEKDNEEEEEAKEEKEDADMSLFCVFGKKSEEKEVIEYPKYIKVNDVLRETIDDELEDCKEKFPNRMSPFEKIKIFTGQGKKRRQVGTFKGIIRVTPDKDSEPPIDTVELLTPQDLFVRLYILEGINLSPKDSNGKSDPYLKIKLGKEKISTRKRYIKSTLNPGFYESFQIPCKIPGACELRIECWDWDGIGDDHIGTTIVDVEDRWFTKEWRVMDLKPIEHRTLRSKTSSAPQGKLRMWVDIVTPEQAKATPMFNIKPPPPIQFQLRCIIWSVKDCATKDEITDQNDLYCTVDLQGGEKGIKRQKTDTHFRAKKGKGNFNWRFLFPISLPDVGAQRKPWPRLKFGIFDRDLIGSNDSIGERTIPLKPLCKRAMKIHKENRKEKAPISYVMEKNLKFEDKFWIKGLKHPNFPDDEAQMQLSLQLVPVSLVAQLAAGPGRGDPNMNPFLPPPEGRLNLSLFHPWDMLRDLCGDKIARKICMFIIMSICAGFCWLVGPSLFSNGLSKLMFG